MDDGDSFRIPVEFDRARIKKLAKIGAVIAIPIIIILVALFFLMDFFIQIQINQQLYQLRLGLDWLMVTFFGGLGLWAVPLITFGILAALVSICNPTTSISLEFILSTANKIRNINKQPMDVFIFTKPSKKAALLWNYLAIALVGGFFIGWTMTSLWELLSGETSLVNLDMALYTINMTGIYWYPNLIFTVLLYPIQPFLNIVGPQTINMEYLYVYIYFYLPLINLIFLFFVIKLAFDLAKAGIDKRRQVFNSLTVFSRIFLLVGICLLWGYFNAPLAPSELEFTTIVSQSTMILLIGSIAFLILGGISAIAGIFMKPSDKDVKIAGRTFNKTFFVSIILALFVSGIFIVGFIGVGINGLFAEARWTSWTWDAHLQTEIYWTRAAAGVSGITENSTDWLKSNTDIVDMEHVRQYDQYASRTKMVNQIGTNWENLADSDIVFLNGKEYWVAPRTIEETVYEGDFINEHIKYSHSRGFIAINVNTGELLSDNQIYADFGVHQNHSIYFGELPENNYFMFEVPKSPPPLNYSEIEDVFYDGTKDVTLSGLFGWWYISDWGWKTVDPINLVVKRNIHNRVGDMLLPYMETGDDPYLVFDQVNNDLYYVVDILLNYPAFSYMRSNIMRWLGICTINVATGEMEIYKIPGVDASLSEFEFVNVYLKAYNWKTTIPTWLIPQLKYPETLQEEQLEVHYKYHVLDSNEWKSGVDFFERPESTDLHHVLYRFGEQNEFVGTNIIEFKSSIGQNLAGIYINEYGDKYGKTTFFRAGNQSGVSDFIGIDVARSSFEQRASEELILITGKRYGNFLLYPLEGSLWYVIPVYSATGGNFETLKKCALVNAFNGEEVYWGSTVQGAYNDLIGNKTSDGNVTLSVTTAGTMREDIPLNVLATITNTGNQSYIVLNVSINLNASYIETHNISVLWNSTIQTGIDYLEPTYDPANRTFLIDNFTMITNEIRGVPFQLLLDQLGGTSFGFTFTVQLYVGTNATDIQLTESRTFSVICYP